PGESHHPARSGGAIPPGQFERVSPNGPPRTGHSERVTRSCDPRRGTLVMLRTFGRSLRVLVTAYAERIARRTATPSISENPAPMHRRTPPPNGIQVLTGGFWPRNRVGSNRSGSGWLSGRLWAIRIDGPTVAPAGRSQPPTVAGRIRVRTTIGITGWSRMASLRTASR